MVTGNDVRSSDFVNGSIRSTSNVRAHGRSVEEEEIRVNSTEWVIYAIIILGYRKRWEELRWRKLGRCQYFR